MFLYRILTYPIIRNYKIDICVYFMSVQNYTKEAIENRMCHQIYVSIQASLESRTTQWWKVAQLGSGKLSNFAPKVEQLSETSRATFRDELPDYRKQVGQLQCRELPDLRVQSCGSGCGEL